MNLETVLSIAGSDPSGGAGIQADLKTFEAHGVYGMSVITALTAQNTLGVQAVMPVPADFIRRQLQSVFEDIVPDAVKIGILPDEDAMRAVAEILDQHHCRNVVIDPVLSSTSGTAFMNGSAVTTLQSELFLRCRLITPNIPEAEKISGMKITSQKDLEQAGEYLAEKFGCSVLIKGGHAAGAFENSEMSNGISCDLLVTSEGTGGSSFNKMWFTGSRIDNPNTHGTGCTLSSAIAGNLAKGAELEEAVKRAKSYIEACIGAGLSIGHGRGPLFHGIDMTDLK
ncbi:MAG: bifunctional hydroxymethylpyrimidine kinase/phosphomethylpyrimidine kinase [Butyrivibrio sp.]|nr:bifunctional hydroxymethylpyrimidine kinase/phosphomethylpyrimidine kinase [Butyrivibrio sp.]